MKSSKLFLVAIVALMLGAFALVGCEKAADPAAGETTSTPDAGGDHKTEGTTPAGDDHKTEGTTAAGEDHKTEGTTPAGDAKPTEGAGETATTPAPAGDEHKTEGH